MLKNFQSGYGVSKKSAIAKREKNDCMVRAVANAFEILIVTGKHIFPF